MPSTSEKRATWLLDKAFVEHAGKTGLIFVTILYSVGLIIENIHLGRCGITDLSLVRPRYIMVGLAFGIYCSIPFAIATIVYLVIAYARSIPLLPRVILGIVAGIWASSLIATPFQYFVTSSEKILNFRVWILDPGFWKVYQPFVFFGIPSLSAYLSFLLHRRFAPTNSWYYSAVSRFFLLIFLTFPIALIVPYTWAVFPNIDYATGGAQPRIVTVLRKGAIAEEKVAEQFLWHSDAGFVYLSAIAQGDTAFRVEAVPLSEVKAIQFHQKVALFDMTARLNRYPDLIGVFSWAGSGDKH